VREFRRRLAGLAKRADGPGLVETIRALIAAVDYKAEVERCYDDPLARETRWAAVEEILNLAENYVRADPKPTLRGFLDDVTLTADDRDEEDGKPRDAVTLMTLHAAKGLEFPRVYLVGVEEGLLPHQKCVAENAVEEERRLMYVGITRAQRRLTITWTRTRAKYGKRAPCVKSRFLCELRGEPFVPPLASVPAETPAAGRIPQSTEARRSRRRHGGIEN
jgi:DNA helicase-2/ATP-dependent DNA helicase PcrA